MNKKWHKNIDLAKEDISILKDDFLKGNLFYQTHLVASSELESNMSNKNLEKKQK